MHRFILRRLGQAVIVLFGLSLLVFFMVRLSGDPARLMMSREASAEDVAAFRRAMGFDRPLLVQYGDFLVHALQGDFGDSLYYRQPATRLIRERFRATVELATGGLLLTLCVGVPLGMIAASRPGSVWDGATQTLALISQSVPIYWAGLVMILIFAVRLGLVPTFGRGEWTSYILPIVTISLQWIGRLARLTRSATLEVLQQDYVLAARAKGARPLHVYFRHVLRNAAVPLVTYVGLAYGYMLGGSVIVESVFAWPGLGYLAYQAISVRDFPLVQAVAIVVSVTFLLLNLLVDLSYALLNPRIRFS
jgi:peptide/nickel transport system permease protein